MSYYKPCPSCGEQIQFYKNPVPTVDIVIYSPPARLVLIERKNFPHGWALPGGFVDYGESAELAAIREAKEETGLDVVLTGILGVYSDPSRDPRSHTISTVFTAYALNLDQLQGGDDASRAALFHWDRLPETAFDHDQILLDFKLSQTRFRPGTR
ncbi:NUDIX domain-containing protein [Desulfonatronovibrio hydrogenovorans]|uniref:NUDIX domain-containing protein n=1 Tax=Desulfonatronovibrio hydrogenovorans TaxID=53245 RepID=UPI00048F74DC|nr:NUDIX hydrolase [Desulfonatronovibrio hydrogenovorans]